MGEILISTAPTSKHWLVETWEQQPGQNPHFHSLRIHKGTDEGLKRHWARWNEQNKPAKRIDRVVSVRSTMQEAVAELKRHIGNRKKTG